MIRLYRVVDLYMRAFICCGACMRRAAFSKVNVLARGTCQFCGTTVPPEESSCAK